MPILDDFAASAPSKGTVVYHALMGPAETGVGALMAFWGYPWGALAFGVLGGAIGIIAMTDARHRALAKAATEEKTAQP